MGNKLSAETVSAMKANSARVVSTYSARDMLFTRYKQMFFMEYPDMPKNENVDEHDWAITISPSSRNEVTGMVRLLGTSDLHITVKDGEGTKVGDSDDIERALKTMLRVSGENLRARIEDDAALSAVLFSPVALYFESIDDLLEVVTNKVYKKQLETIRKKTPVLIHTIAAEQSYPEWGDWGMIGHTWKYELKGAVVKQRWGVENVNPETNYKIIDIWDSENHLTYAEGIEEPLFGDEHGLVRLPIVVRYAGGSSLFAEPEKQMNSFLYGKAKGNLDKRENALLTNFATAVNVKGLNGPLIAVDPESVQNGAVKVNYDGHLRTITAKAQQIQDNIDPTLFQWKNWLDDLGGQSTIYKQTLGENINAGTFSSLAMLSSAGKLPLVDPQRAITLAFTDIFLSILQRIKDDGIENTLIEPTQIPDDVDIEVTLQPKLPQDSLRNATIAGQLGDSVSDEWKHTELLQISDSKAMVKQVMKEKFMRAIFEKIMTSEELMMQFITSAMGKKRQPVAQTATPTVPSPMPTDPMMPTSQMPNLPMQPTGMEALPQVDAMIPPQERI